MFGVPAPDVWKHNDVVTRNVGVEVHVVRAKRAKAPTLAAPFALTLETTEMAGSDGTESRRRQEQKRGGGDAVVDRLIIPDVATIVSARVDLRVDDSRNAASNSVSFDDNSRHEAAGAGGVAMPRRGEQQGDDNAAMTAFQIVLNGNVFVPLDPNALVDGRTSGCAFAARVSAGFARRRVSGHDELDRPEENEVFFTMLDKPFRPMSASVLMAMC